MSKHDIPIVDFHSHILPCVDHGSASLEVSEQLLIQAKKAGVTTIVATPHFYASKTNLDEFLAKREEGYSALLRLMEEKPEIAIPIRLGAEVALEKKLWELSDLTRLAIENTNHILIEMPMFRQWRSWMFDHLYEIQKNNRLQVILAHIDRYPDQNIEKLFDMSFSLQINATAMVKGRAKRYYRSLCEEGLVHLIGSDAHDIKDRNYKDMTIAHKKLSPEVQSFFYDNAIEILK